MLERRASVTLWISATSVCSTCLLLSNKVLLNVFGSPLLICLYQLTMAGLVAALKLAFEGYTRIGKRDLALYIVEAWLFAISLYANMQALMHTSVGAVIVGRSTVPVLTFLLERSFFPRKHGMFSLRHFVPLVGICCFSWLYVITDGQVQIRGRRGLCWLAVWICLVSLQMNFGKWLINAVSLKRWERVFYTNSCALPFVGFKLLVRGDMPHVLTPHPTVVLPYAFVLLLSCVAGVMISYSSWRLREIISPTAFGIVGVVNKMITVVVSSMIWPTEFSLAGTLAIIGVIASALSYGGSGSQTHQKKKTVSESRTHQKNTVSKYSELISLSDE